MREFDLIVIGSGSGLDVAHAAAARGLQVAIVERGPLGGTCLNRGCIPSKMLIHSADVVETIKRAHLFGINVRGYSIDFSSIVDRVTVDIDKDAKGIESGLGAIDNPLLFKGDCSFVDHKTLQVGGKTIRAEKILIASGARPSVPNIEGLRESGFITSDDALRLKAQPKVLTIIGGGYIAVELAHFFGELGTGINIVQRRDLLVPNEDEEVARAITNIFKQKYNILTGFNPEKVSKVGDEFEVTVRGVDGGEVKTLRSDQLLVATGRKPNSDGLDVDKTGVKTDGKGLIITDEYLETDVKGIFALGDAVGHYMFKHSANLEAQYAFNNLLHLESKMQVDYAVMPHAIFTSPQIAGVGKTEQQLRAEKADYAVGRYNYLDTGMGQAIQDETGFVKMLVDRGSGKILGCHIMGTDASTLIHEVLVAMKMGDGSVGSIINTVHVHPALSEVVQRAASNVQ
jgi:mycothione reductase